MMQQGVNVIFISINKKANYSFYFTNMYIKVLNLHSEA